MIVLDSLLCPNVGPIFGGEEGLFTGKTVVLERWGQFRGSRNCANPVPYMMKQATFATLATHNPKSREHWRLPVLSGLNFCHFVQRLALAWHHDTRAMDAKQRKMAIEKLVPQSTVCRVIVKKP